MLLSLSEIMNLNHESRMHEVDIEMDICSYMGEEYEFIRKEPVSVRLTSLGSRKVLVEAVADLSISVPCSRCLKAVEIPFHVDVRQQFDFSEEVAEPEDDDISYITGYDLDIDEMIREEIMLGFPMKVLCDEDCKGLCKVCGANLNDGECGCDRTESDPRMAVIRDLFKDFN